VIGLAPDGGRLPPEARQAVLSAVRAGLNVDSGLHDFLGEDPEIASLAARHGVRLRDVRRPPPRHRLHFFSRKITEVPPLPPRGPTAWSSSTPPPGVSTTASPATPCTRWGSKSTPSS